MHLTDLKAGLSQTTSAFWQKCTGYASLTAVGHQESPDPLAQASTFLPKKQITVRPTFLVRAKCVAYIASTVLRLTGEVQSPSNGCVCFPVIVVDYGSRSLRLAYDPIDLGIEGLEIQMEFKSIIYV